jgi:hypothetical protein
VIFEATMATMTADVERWVKKMASLTGGGATKAAAPSAGSKTRNPELPADDKFKFTEIAAQLFTKGNTDGLDIDPNDVDQGYLGDCWFMAAVAAVARAKPEALRKLIKANADGSYDVTIYVDKWFSVKGKPKVIKNVRPTFPTDENGKPAFAGLGDKELWVMILEKAYAIHVGGYDDLDEGGDAGDAIAALSGVDAESYGLSGMSEKEILDKINSAIKNKRPIVASSQDFDKSDKKKSEIVAKLGIAGNHAYSVKGVTGTNVDLHNPWGHSDISVPVADFKKYFDELDIAEQ